MLAEADPQLWPDCGAAFQPFLMCVLRTVYRRVDLFNGRRGGGGGGYPALYSVHGSPESERPRESMDEQGHVLHKGCNGAVSASSKDTQGRIETRR